MAQLKPEEPESELAAAIRRATEGVRAISDLEERTRAAQDLINTLDGGYDPIKSVRRAGVVELHDVRGWFYDAIGELLDLSKVTIGRIYHSADPMAPDD